MTTITVDEGCLKDVDRLQSLLKLRYDTLSGETITRGATVEWAVNQQISAMTVPVTFLDNFIEGTACNTTPTAAVNAFNTNWQNTPGNPIMVAYMATSTSTILPSSSQDEVASKKSHRSH